MSLADELYKQPNNPKYFDCKIKYLLDELDKVERQALVVAINKVKEGRAGDKTSGIYPWTAIWLRGVLANNGYIIGKLALRKHLEGKCSCGIK
jgi:hypothetical protein